MARQIIGHTSWQPCQVTTNCDGEIPSQMELDMRQDKTLMEQDKIFQAQQEMMRNQYELEQRQKEQEKQFQEYQDRIKEEQQQRDKEYQDRIDAQIRQTYQPTTTFTMPVITSFESSFISDPLITNILSSSNNFGSSSFNNDIFGKSDGPAAYKYW